MKEEVEEDDSGHSDLTVMIKFFNDDEDEIRWNVEGIPYWQTNKYQVH